MQSNLVFNTGSFSLQSKQCRTKEIAKVSLLSQFKENKETGKLEMIAHLEDSKVHWKSWFIGLSQNFLDIAPYKLLVLAGTIDCPSLHTVFCIETDYLDKTLLIGQMQGKFQLEIIRNTGHAIQEDQPKKLAEIFNNFIRRAIEMKAFNQSLIK